MPEISIILPAANAEAIIGRSIESVIGQSFQDWELLVVDAASGDETAAVVKRYSNEDPRISYIRRTEPGLTKARNAALARIPLERPYLAFIDSGMLWSPEKLDTQLGQLHQHGSDVVFCNADAIRYEGESGVPVLLDATVPSLSAMLCRRPLLEAIGNFPQTPASEARPGFILALGLLREGHTLEGFPETMISAIEAGAPVQRLEIIRLELAALSGQRFGLAAAESAVRQRVLELYREQFDLLAAQKDKAGIRSRIPALNAFLGNPRIGSALGNMLFLPSGLYRKFAHWLLSSLMK